MTPTASPTWSANLNGRFPFRSGTSDSAYIEHQAQDLDLSRCEAVPAFCSLLLNQLETGAVLFGPPRLQFNHRLERPDVEGIAPAMRCHGYAATIGMDVALMRSNLANENKAIATGSGNQIAGGQRPQVPVVDCFCLFRRHP